MRYFGRKWKEENEKMHDNKIDIDSKIDIIQADK